GRTRTRGTTPAPDATGRACSGSGSRQSRPTQGTRPRSRTGGTRSGTSATTPRWRFPGPSARGEGTPFAALGLAREPSLGTMDRRRLMALVCRGSWSRNSLEEMARDRVPGPHFLEQRLLVAVQPDEHRAPLHLDRRDRAVSAEVLGVLAPHPFHERPHLGLA